jgi:hypothetical protein
MLDLNVETDGSRGLLSLQSGGITMRKRIIESVNQGAAYPDDEWLDLEALADVEITSEDPARPIEHASLPGQPSG